MLIPHTSNQCREPRSGRPCQGPLTYLTISWLLELPLFVSFSVEWREGGSRAQAHGCVWAEESSSEVGDWVRKSLIAQMNAAMVLFCLMFVCLFMPSDVSTNIKPFSLVPVLVVLLCPLAAYHRGWQRVCVKLEPALQWLDFSVCGYMMSKPIDNQCEYSVCCLFVCV